MPDSDDPPMQHGAESTDAAPPAPDDESAGPGAVRAMRRKALRDAPPAKVVDLNERRERGGGPGGPGGPGGGNGGGAARPGVPFISKAYYENALVLLEEKFTEDGYRTLLYQDGLMAWSERDGWRPQSRAALDAEIYRFFDGREEIGRQGKSVTFHVNDGFTSNVVSALAARVHCAEKYAPPCYLPAPDDKAAEARSGWPPAEHLVPVANGLVNYMTLTKVPPTPAFFSFGASRVAFDPYAECPLWFAFNLETFGGDMEMVQAAQEFAGYCLSDLTSMQKIGWLMGPTRSGKSTWTKMVEQVIGVANVIGPSMFTLAQPFGLQSFIGKKLAVFGDARVPERADRKIILDRILSISGEDTQTIDRKFQETWSGRLPTRLLFISNELPELADTANAFAARVILLRTKKSLLGNEDEGLEYKLRAELPGILNWMLAGLRRLRKRGHFIQPAASADALTSLRDLSSPMSAFLAQCCDLAPKLEIRKQRLYEARVAWDEKQGVRRKISQAQFGKQISAAVEGISERRLPRSEDRERVYVGVTLSAGGWNLINQQPEFLESE